MTKQEFRIVSQFYEVTIHFDTAQTHMGEAFLIEAERIKKCVDEGKSFVESKHRVIVEGKSLPATISGSPL